MKAFGNTYSKSNLLKLHKPIISDVSPNSAFYLDTITILGKHFNNAVKWHNTVHIGNAKAEILEIFRDSIKVVVPNEATYSNTSIQVFSQNEYANYNGFSLYEPKFSQFPREVYLGKEYDVSFDRKVPRSKVGIYFGDQSVGYHTNNGSSKMVIYSNPYHKREYPLVWKITNDKEIVSDFNVKIINPFYSIPNSQDNRTPFKDFSLAYSKNKAYVLGLDYNVDGMYLYTYDDVNNSWIRKDRVQATSNGFSIFTYFNKIIFSEYNGKIYGVTESINGGNFFELNVNTSEVKELPSLPIDKLYKRNLGKGFAYKNSVYIISGKYLNELWKYDIDKSSWEKYTDLPLEDNSRFERNHKICINIIDDYVYFNNGVEGNQYSDFWRLDMQNITWKNIWI